MPQITATERTLRFATNVDGLPSAWSFVMEHLDEVGKYPSISIKPVWVFHDDGDESEHFTVVVEGMVEV